MKILLVEDEKQMADAETAFLQLKGIEVDNAYDGEEAEQKINSGVYDVIVLDIMLPKKDGIAVLKDLRLNGNTTPVIMLTAKADVDDRIDGLSAGADDYLSKPFALRELEARIYAQIRRSERFSSDTVTYKNLALNIGEQELKCNNSIRLAGKETKLMEYLIRNAERRLTAEEIYARVWGEQDTPDKNVVDLYISYLNDKMKAVSAEAVIKTDDNYMLCESGENL